jgi:hypothetical protein
MALQVMKHNEVLVVQVPASWSVKDIRLEQGRVTRAVGKLNASVKIIIVGGGSEPQVIPPVTSVIGEVMAGEDEGEDADETQPAFA